jgi:hypothetical protein
MKRTVTITFEGGRPTTAEGEAFMTEWMKQQQQQRHDLPKLTRWVQEMLAGNADGHLSIHECLVLREVLDLLKTLKESTR